jgi:hypothetical protein
VARAVAIATQEDLRTDLVETIQGRSEAIFEDGSAATALQDFFAETLEAL